MLRLSQEHEQHEMTGRTAHVSDILKDTVTSIKPVFIQFTISNDGQTS